MNRDGGFARFTGRVAKFIPANSSTSRVMEEVNFPDQIEWAINANSLLSVLGTSERKRLAAQSNYLGLRRMNWSTAQEMWPMQGGPWLPAN